LKLLLEQRKKCRFGEHRSKKGSGEHRSTMASTYRKQFTYPDGFQRILKDFAREVIREQPENICAFGAKYFEELLDRRRQDAEEALKAAQAPPPVGIDLRTLSAEQLQDLFMRIFADADVNGDGSLDAREFKKIIRTADLGLSKDEILQIMVEADENDDGHIDYNEFIPVAVQVVQAIYNRASALADREARMDIAEQRAENVLLHGMTQDEVESMLETLFRAADTDSSGKLSRKEFRECLRHTDLGLTRKEINAIMAEIDADQDGLVSYDEFKPLCFKILLSRFKISLVELEGTQGGLESSLLDVFSAADPEGRGYLSHGEIRDLLRGADIGLTRMQIYTVLSSGEQTPDGLINYRLFVPTAAKMIRNILAVRVAEARAKAIASVSQVSESELLRGIDQQKFEMGLRAEFIKYDQDGSGSLERSELRAALESGGLSLNSKEVNTLMAAIDVDADGRINYSEFISYAFNILVQIAREAYIDTQVAAYAA